MIYICIAIFTLIVLTESVGNLNYFETFDDIDVDSKVKRSKAGPELIKELKFKIFRRSFHLTVKSGTYVLAENFKAQLVESDNKLTTFQIDPNLLYSGHLTDKKDIFVSAHMEEDLWTIHIYEQDDTYSVEPARNILMKSENPLNHSFIAYRASDFKEDSGNCGTVESNLNSVQDANVTFFDHREKVRRAQEKPTTPYDDPRRNTCTMSLIGDYDLFNHRCNRNFLTCTAVMISAIEHGDWVFRKSRFIDKEDNYVTGIGLQIKQLTLYTTPTYSPDTTLPHFNAKDIQWNAFSKLNSFQYYISFRKQQFCLTHLMTSYPLPMRILGIADLKSICSVAKQRFALKSSSLSSTIDSYSGPLTSHQHNQVVIHGHNFGSDHDSKIPLCAQNEQNGGRYIMWEKIGSGTEPNNKMFSECSLRNIGDHLHNVYCLVARHLHSEFCGNGMVEAGEECDAGTRGLVNADLCCTKLCRLHAEATCSDMNTQCCSNCHIARYGIPCYNHTVIACKTKSFCTEKSGNSYMCPPADDLPDGTSCLNGGVCIGGDCKSFCEVKSWRENVTLKSCLCTEAEDACRWCCYNNSDPKNPGQCVPHSPEILKDGWPCYSGYCQKGLCKSNITSTIRRISSYITSVPTTGYFKFLRSNIVLLVVSSSLIVWYLQVLFVKYYEQLCWEQKRESFNNEKHLELKEIIIAEFKKAEEKKDSLVIFQPPSSVHSTNQTETPSNASNTSSATGLPLPLPADG